MGLPLHTSLNSAICFWEKRTKTEDGAFFALRDDEPRVEPRCEPAAESEGVGAAGVSAPGVSAGVSSLDDAFFFLTFFSFSDYGRKMESIRTIECESDANLAAQQHPLCSSLKQVSNSLRENYENVCSAVTIFRIGSWKMHTLHGGVRNGITRRCATRRFHRTILGGSSCSQRCSLAFKLN